MPAVKTATSIKSKIEHSRKSLDKNFTIWDQAWTKEELEKMKKDPSIKLLSHEEALKLMNEIKWKDPKERGRAYAIS